MTGTATTPTPQARPRRRLWRLFAPLAAVLVVIVSSIVIYKIERPDRTDPAYLSPSSRADVGGARLADRLRERGVKISRFTRTSEALVEANKGGATLFVPTPELVHPFYLRMIKLLPATTRVVIVAADERSVRNARLPASVTGARLASRAAEPKCGYAPATRAGTAAALRIRYTATKKSKIDSCYGGGLTVVRKGGAEVALVGADDPFRNDRIGELGNAALATALLGSAPRLLWLDLKRIETRPGYTEDPTRATEEPAPASLGPGSPDPDFPILESPNPAAEDDGSPTPRPTRPVSAENPLSDAFPPWFFAVAALIGLAGLLGALAAGRRLGAPVPEPLPVAVRATETVEGRGHLYQRAKARDRAAATLRESAITRLEALLNLPPTATRQIVVSSAATHSGWLTDDVDEALFGPDPVDDRELIQAAIAIEELLRAVTREASPTTTRSEGEPR